MEDQDKNDQPDDKRQDFSQDRNAVQTLNLSDFTPDDSQGLLEGLSHDYYKIFNTSVSDGINKTTFLLLFLLLSATWLLNSVHQDRTISIGVSSMFEDPGDNSSTATITTGDNNKENNSKQIGSVSTRRRDKTGTSKLIILSDISAQPKTEGVMENQTANTSSQTNKWISYVERAADILAKYETSSGGDSKKRTQLLLQYVEINKNKYPDLTVKFLNSGNYKIALCDNFKEFIARDNNFNSENDLNKEMIYNWLRLYYNASNKKTQEINNEISCYNWVISKDSDYECIYVGYNSPPKTPAVYLGNISDGINSISDQLAINSGNSPSAPKDLILPVYTSNNSNPQSRQQRYIVISNCSTANDPKPKYVCKSVQRSQLALITNDDTDPDGKY